jgi:hypothetical protein
LVPGLEDKALTSSFPGDNLAVGDSFFISNDDCSPEELIEEIAAAEKTGRCKYQTAAQNGGTRIWRIA